MSPVDGRSRRAWGWYRLTDEWAARLVKDAGIQPGELVLDIGAGTGAITARLLAAGAHVIAVELHPGRVAHLRRRFSGTPITVVRADAATLRLPRRPFRVVANPPYAIASALMRVLLSPGSRLDAADVVLQRAVVRSYVDGTGGGRKSCAFVPSPRVDSAVLVIRRW